MRFARSLRRSGAKLLAAFTALLLLAGTSLALAAEDGAQAEAGGGDGASSSSATPIPGNAEEIPAERTATSRTYELPNGANTTEVFQTPINYREPDGDWKPIETDLHEVKQGPGITNGPNDFDLRLPDAMGEEAVRLTEEDQWVSYRLLGSSADLVELAGDGATYETASGKVAFELTSIPTGIKEDIVLDDVSAPSSFTFELRAAVGLTPEIAGNGSLRFKNQDGETFAVLPAPTIADASGMSSTTTEAVSYSLTEGSNGSWRLIVAADPQWLADSEREWPVRIDPTVELASDPYEGVIGAAFPPYGWGVSSAGYPRLLAAYVPNTPETARYLVRFGLGILTLNDSIYDATLSLYSPMVAENTPGIEARQLTTSAKMGADWQRAFNISGWTGNWNTPGGDFNPSVGATITTLERGSQVGWWNFKSNSLTDLVSDWAKLITPNYGLILKQTNETNAGLCTPAPPNCKQRNVEWYSSTGLAGYRPKLTVSYWPVVPAQAKVVTPSNGTVSAKRVRLQAGWENGVAQVAEWQYRIGKSGIYRPIPSELLRDGEGKAVSWPENVEGVKKSKAVFLDASQLSPTLRKKGGELRLRTRFTGTVSGVSAPVAVKIDPALGGPKDATVRVGPGSVDMLTGNFTVMKTDVSIPVFDSALDFSRTFSSRDAGKLSDSGVLGQGWKPGVPVEENGAGEWRSIKFVVESEEGFPLTRALVTGIDGREFPFEKEGSNYITPDELTGWTLTAPNESEFVLTTPDGTKTTFDNKEGNPSEYLPKTVSQTGGSSNSIRMNYNVDAKGNRRLVGVVSPSPPGVDCSSAPNSTPGCKTLQFTYEPATKWGGPSSSGDRLYRIWLWTPGYSTSLSLVSEYSYDPNGRLKAVMDPRISPELKETYSYNSAGQIETITLPGLKPWTMEYTTLNEEEVSGRLKAVKRDSLIPSEPVAQTTIAYGVPTSGSGAPYPMNGTDVAKWGQSDVPADATAIFPPSQVPSTSPPSSYSRATVYYMDPDGNSVNTVTPAGAGTEAASISTTETDEYGNLTRELTPQNRLRALASSGSSASVSHELETSRVYEDEGTEMVKELGPTHDVRIQEGPLAGQVIRARSYLHVDYDQVKAWETLPKPAPHVPTTEESGAWVEGVLYDRRIDKTVYDWSLLMPTKTIVDSGGLNIESVTTYDGWVGQPAEVRQPSDASSPGAGSTKTIYYRASVNVLVPQCGGRAQWAGLPCYIMPVKQPGTAGLPKLKTTEFTSYNHLGQPSEVIERLGAEGATRKTVTTYDEAGRILTIKRTGGGTEVPMVKAEYDSETGMPTAQKFVCESSCSGFDDQAVTTVYDALGRAEKFEDADGNTSKVTYDLLGRPITTNDGKGTQTWTYDLTTGLLTKLEDSAAGTFTAAYDADGNMIEEGLPNGLVADQTYNEVGQLTGLVYDKAGNPWLDFDAERSINGQILWQKSLTSHQEYSYDKAGRLIKTKDWDAATGGNCTTREYMFEESAGKNSNRTKLRTRQPGIAGACAESGGTTQSYAYDGADRLTGEGIAYDDFGRITSLPSVYAGGKALTTTYFSTDMVSSQAQNGVTNTFQLDASLRQRQRTQGGSFEGVEVLHYADTSDTPVWTQLGSKWSRNIPGIGGRIAAIQESGSGTLLQLTNLHGDIVATATLSPSATEPLATTAYDEFGVPGQEGPKQFGWLGSEGRRTEFASGAIQMGVRSYVPALGRFLSVDPILGGSANAYDYVNADPVNNLDLTGEAPYAVAVTGPCGGRLHMWSHKSSGPRAGYGIMGVRWRLKCRGSAMSIHILKITLRFEEKWSGRILREKVRQPFFEGVGDFQGTMGTWNTALPERFQCLVGNEYQFSISIQIEWVYDLWLVALNPEQFEPGGGSLNMTAQEYCGHGRY